MNIMIRHGFYLLCLISFCGMLQAETFEQCKVRVKTCLKKQVNGLCVRKTCGYPCLNSGVCQPQIDPSGTIVYGCVCQDGFTGDRCEIDIDDCVGIDCGNGTCVDQVNTYVCACDPGYSGLACEIEINRCASAPCQNGGTCNALTDSYSCDCPLDVTGINCETQTDQCLSGPCLNGGTCEDDVDGYMCVCVPEFSGVHCESSLCQDGQLYGSGSCYAMLVNRLSWDDASSACQAAGNNGHLIYVDDDAEQKFIEALPMTFTDAELNNYKTTCADCAAVYQNSADCATYGRGLWTGGHRANAGNAANFDWMPVGESIAYTQWALGEPARDDQSDDCILMGDGLNDTDAATMRWFDQACSWTLCYVCEYDTLY